MVRWENGKDESYMRIVVLDGYTENPGDLSWKGLEDLGDLTVYDRTPKDRVVERIGRAEAVYTNKTPISARTIESCGLSGYWPQAIILWTYAQPEMQGSLFPTFLPTAQMQWPSTPLPCFWSCATMWGTTAAR